MFKKIILAFTHRPSVFSLIIFGLSLSLLGLLVQHELGQTAEKAKQHAQIQLLTLAARLKGEVLTDTMVLKALETHLVLHGISDPAEFASMVTHYQKTRPSLRHVAIAPDLKVTFVHPVAGNEAAMGLDYRKTPAQMAAIQRAIDEREMIVTGPIKLVQGGTALVARLPVFLDHPNQTFWGLITGVFHDRILFERVGLNQGFKGFDIAVRNQGGKTGEWNVFYGSETAFSENAVIADIDLPGDKWQIAALPKGQWPTVGESAFKLWGIAVILSLIFSTAIFSIMKNYREKLSALQSAKDRTNYDVLTGLSNRYYFSQMLEQTIEYHKRYKQKFALFYLNMDFFKEVNEEWGQQTGDELLCLLAERLRQNVRNDDLIARIAGDEFIIVLNNMASGTEAEILAEKLKQELAQSYSVEDEQIAVTNSLGVALFPQDGLTIDVLLQNAEKAMVQAKREGRNRIAFFNSELNEKLQRHVQIHNEILEGIRESQFEMYFQPIMDLESGSIKKCEALVRWNHPRKGLISPFHFISIAEQTGAIVPLGNWVLEETCHLLNRMKRLGLNINISVNRSVVEFQPNLAIEEWLETLKTYAINPNELVFEITESLFMEGADQQLEKIHKLRNEGIGFSIDDFGTGYSAINYLRNYPVDFLKIDRSFVQDILTDSQDRTLVEVIIKMGQTLGIQVIAEGVEEPEQLELLRQFGCDYVQGYLLGKPMPYDAFIQVLKAEES